MHMSDALVSPAVAVAAGAAAVGLIIAASSKVKNDQREGLASTMGIMGAFVFAAQMINFTIPGTGSSGHIIGGILLSAILGPWAGFLTLCSVLIVQCLVFADGGLMALGCNIINMAVASCLVAYPLIYKPIIGKSAPTAGRVMLASVLACVAGLELGAFLVSVETVLSGVTALPFKAFIGVMLPIHLVIGACEGVATGLVLSFVLKNSPEMLEPEKEAHATIKNRKKTLIAFAALAVVFAIGFTWIASANPDGLEWSIARLTGSAELAPASAPITAFMPDYESYFAGVIGAAIVMTMVWGLSMMVFRHKRSSANL